MRIVAVSDIHGHFKELTTALEEAEFVLTTMNICLWFAVIVLIAAMRI